MKIAFNTGALYTENGQRIGAWVERQPQYRAVICFIDFDRMIEGCFEFHETGQFNSPIDYARHVMRMYDWGQYHYAADDGVRERMSDVRRAGYDAFVNDPDARVIARFSR